MSKADRLIRRLLSKPSDFSYDEAKTLLERFCYIEYTSGKTAGSRVKFVHSITKHIIMLHRPHPSNILKAYQVHDLITGLKDNNLL